MVGPVTQEPVVPESASDLLLGEYLLEWLERRASQLVTAYLLPRVGERRPAELGRCGLKSLFARPFHRRSWATRFVGPRAGDLTTVDIDHRQCVLSMCG
jgi:hypothetical protein